MIAGEALLFLSSCLLGGSFGVLYDGFRVLRLFIPTGEKLAFIEDGLFFLLITAMNFLFFLSRTYGTLRVFLLVGELLGFLIYYLTVGRAVFFLMLHLSRGIKRAFHGTIHICAKIISIVARKFRNKTVDTDENIGNQPDS